MHDLTNPKGRGMEPEKVLPELGKTTTAFPHCWCTQRVASGIKMKSHSACLNVHPLKLSAQFYLSSLATLVEEEKRQGTNHCHSWSWEPSTSSIKARIFKFFFIFLELPSCTLGSMAQSLWTLGSKEEKDLSLVFS